MTSAEQRAKELIFALEATTSRDVITSGRQRDLITTAIRDAENAKLEEAASHMEQRMDQLLSEERSPSVIAAEIRSLITKD